MNQTLWGLLLVALICVSGLLRAVNAADDQKPDTAAKVAEADDDEDDDEDESDGSPSEQAANLAEHLPKAAAQEMVRRRAEELLEDSKEETAKPLFQTSPDALVNSLLVGVEKKTITQGDSVELLVGFHNKGSIAFNVTEIFAAIVWGMDFNQFVQNFTKQALSVLVKPGEERTFLYPFTPDPMLEPREWGLVATVKYNHDGDNATFVSTLLNTTFALAEPPSTFDAQTLFTYVLFAGLLGLAAYGGFKAFGANRGHRSARSSARATQPEMGTVASDGAAANEWLEGTAADPRLAANASWSKSNKKKN